MNLTGFQGKFLVFPNKLSFVNEIVSDLGRSVLC